MKRLADFINESIRGEYKFSYLVFDEDKWHRASEKAGHELEKIDFCTAKEWRVGSYANMKKAVKQATKVLKDLSHKYYAITVESPDGDEETVTLGNMEVPSKRYEMEDLFLNPEVSEWIKDGSFSVKQLQDAVNDLIKNNENSYYRVKNNKGEYRYLFDPGNSDRPYDIKDDNQAYEYALRRMKKNSRVDAVSISSGEPGMAMDFIKIVMNDRFLASVKSGRL